MTEFNTKTVKIGNRDTNLWSEFPDHLLDEFIDRWVYRKTKKGDPSKILGDP